MGDLLQHFDINQKGRDFVVGDLHGCIDQFEALLKKLEFDIQKDRMFSVGDLVDRGPDSMACLRLLAEPWFHAVLGNHEDLMLDAVSSNLQHGTAVWMNNGGDWGVERFEEGDPEFFDLIDRVASLPYAITIQSHDLGVIGVSHAEPPSQWTSAAIEQDAKPLLWARKKIAAESEVLTKGQGADFTVHGHTIREQITVRDEINAFWIDLGCYVTGRLCAVQVSGPGVKWPEPYYAVKKWRMIRGPNRPVKRVG